MQLFDVISQQRRMRILGVSLSVAGEAQLEVVTCAAFAACDQADYLIVTNKAGLQQGLYIDKDAAGVLPTAAEFLALANQVPITIVTGDLAADVGAALALALTLADVTATDNTDGTVDILQDVYGDCENIVSAKADGSATPDSFSVAVSNEGVDAEMSLGSDCSVVQDEAGVFVLTFSEPFELAPQVGIISKTDNLVGKVVASSKLSVTIGLDLVTSGAAADGLFSALILGSDSADSLRNG